MPDVLGDDWTREFDEWLRTVDNLPRRLMKTELKVFERLIDQALMHEVPYEVIDRLHWFIEKKDTCPTCGDGRCGCFMHQQSCSHIVREYMEEQERLGDTM